MRRYGGHTNLDGQTGKGVGQRGYTHGCSYGREGGFFAVFEIL